MTVKHDHDELEPLLDRGRDLAGHHQVRPITDHYEDLVARGRHLHPEAAGNLVAHRRVAILEVIGTRSPGAPQFVEITRQAARGADDRPLRLGGLADEPNGLWLRHQVRAGEVEHPVDLGVPRGAQPVCQRPTVRVDANPAAGLERLGQLLDACAGSTDQWHGRRLGGVKLGHVETHESNLGVLPGSPARRREVRQSCADRQDEVGIVGQPVRG